MEQLGTKLRISNWIHHEDWADAEAAKIRCVLTHALDLTKRTPKAKCPVIASVKMYLIDLLSAGRVTQKSVQKKSTLKGMRLVFLFPS